MTSHSYGIISLKTNSDSQQAWESSAELWLDICTGKAQRTTGGRRDEQPLVGWFPWHLRERPFYSRPRVTPCDEVVQINPPFHPAWLLACVEAALMEWIHTHNSLFDSNTFGLRNKCMGAPCPLCFQTYNTAFMYISDGIRLLLWKSRRWVLSYKIQIIIWPLFTTTKESLWLQVRLHSDVWIHKG